jgi:LacI family transcriptional regulator
VRHVLVLVEIASSVGRGITVGVWRGKRGFGDWRTTVIDQLTDERTRPAIAAFDGDGVIARVHDARLAGLLRAKNLPVVDVLASVPNAGFPVVTVDDRAIGREGARHLMDLGHTHFGFVQVTDSEEIWARERREAFAAAVGRRPVSVLELTWREATSDASRTKMGDWLAALPRPVGVMACSDRMALLVVARCARVGIAVPEVVSIVGVDDDPMFCAMAEVPLSSVRIDHSRIGYEASVLLERLMRGETPPSRPVLVAPSGVAVRASSDVFAVEDGAVVSALKLIRQRACGAIHLRDVARHAGVSRTLLQRRFREALGRSVHEEIVRVRLEEAKRLLSETDLAIPVVAERAGIQSQAYLCRLFRSKLGTTPARYRRSRKPQQ